MNQQLFQALLVLCGAPIVFVAIGWGLCEMAHRVELRRRDRPWGKP